MIPILGDFLSDGVAVLCLITIDPIFLQKNWFVPITFSSRDTWDLKLV